MSSSSAYPGIMNPTGTWFSQFLNSNHKTSGHSVFGDGSAVKSQILNSDWINEASNFETTKFKYIIYAEEKRSVGES